MQPSSANELKKQYNKVIDALIPYQQAGRLLEGLNKFSSRLPSTVRTAIKDEVLRLTSLTDAPADNSDFAAFPVQRFSHFGIDMRLDKVGRQILMEETAKYLDRYTVGVFETVMNSDHYQSHIRKEQQKKIAQAFTVQSQSYQDINFGDDLAVKPRFSVASQSFEKGKSCAVVSLSIQSFTVETSRIPTEDANDGIFSFSFPETKGLCKQGTLFFCSKTTSEFNRTTNRFNTTFRFVPPTPRKQLQALGAYIHQHIHSLPLQRDLEVERVIQNLDRDHILANSPWIPLFLTSEQGRVEISTALMSQVNFEFNNGFNTLGSLPGKRRLTTLMPELKEHKETFVIRGQFQTKKGPVSVTASFRELRDAGMLAYFIKMAQQTKSVSVLHLRLIDITDAPKTLAYDIHDMQKRDFPELEAITYGLFCKDVSAQLGELVVPDNVSSAKFPTMIIDKGLDKPIEVVMESSLDRRAEPRYHINKNAVIKTGLFKKTTAMVNDLSASGLKITLEPDSPFAEEKHVKVSVPELKLRNETYNVVSFDRDTGVMRLAMSAQHNGNAAAIKQIIHTNTGYFKARNIAKKQQSMYRFLWEISVRNLPSVAVLTTQNRHLLSRLCTVYSDFDSPDLHPFKPANNAVQLHGLFADKHTEKPKSGILKSLLIDGKQDIHVVHAIRKKDKRIIFIDEKEFMVGQVRQQIAEHVGNAAVEACVTQLNAIRCRSHHTPLTQKRLAFISELDTDLYAKLRELQRIYTHIIYITNMSALHNVLLEAGISFSTSTSTESELESDDIKRYA